MVEGAARGTGLRAGLLVLRVFEFIFAVTLVGIFAWDHSTMYRAGYYSLYVSDVPLGFSVAALVISVLAAISLFVSKGSQIIFSVLDFFLFAGFFASSIVYRQNFHVHCWSNVLVPVFASVGSPHCGTVRTGAALLVIQTILFFWSMIMTAAVPRRRVEVVDNNAAIHEEKRRFSFGRRSHQQSDVVAEPTAV
ncbi:hypothetical protein TWF281_002352 [Arthrobotrys megalospora]